MRIIAFAGPPGSGKTAFCRELAFIHGYRHLNFADALKKAAGVLWDLSDAQLYGNQKTAVDPRWGVSPRTILQHMGTEHARHLCPDVHVRRLMSALSEPLEDHEPGYCIGDVRFENEFTALKEAGALMVYLFPWDPGRKVKGGIPNHSSEKALELRMSRFDVVMETRGSLEQEAQWIKSSWPWNPRAKEHQDHDA